MSDDSRSGGSSQRLKVAIVSACAVVLAAAITAIVPQLLRPPKPQEMPAPVVEAELRKEIAGVTVKIKCTGFIHDEDYISADDEESFSIEHTINLIPNHPSTQVSRSTQVVGGEVRLDMLLALKATEKGDVSVSGSFELWEGLIWNRAAHERIAESLIPSPGSITVYDGRIDDKEGDYADVKLVVEAIPYLKAVPQEPKKK